MATAASMKARRMRLTDFVRLAGPALGAVVCKWRNSPKSGLGHVGFYAGHDTRAVSSSSAATSPTPVSKASFDPAQLTGYFWPKGQPLPAIGKVNTGVAVASAT